jgi:hypothetical protein
LSFFLSLFSYSFFFLSSGTFLFIFGFFLLLTSRFSLRSFLLYLLNS